MVLKISAQNPRRMVSHLMYMPENGLSTMPLREDSEKETSPGWWNVNENKSESHKENHNTLLTVCVLYL